MDVLLTEAHLNHTYIHETIKTLMPGWLASGWMSIMLYYPREIRRAK